MNVISERTHNHLKSFLNKECLTICKKMKTKTRKREKRHAPVSIIDNSIFKHKKMLGLDSNEC